MNGQNFQCSHCGTIKHIDGKVGQIIDGIFYEVYCPKCGVVTPHLDIGYDILDKYQLYDCTFDERFFIYNKTK